MLIKEGNEGSVHFMGGDPTKQPGKVCPGEEGGPPQGRQQLKTRLQQSTVCRSVKVFTLWTRAFSEHEHTPHRESTCWQRTPRSPVFTLSLGWDLPQQWPG